ncbi:MAG: hypothetical protein F8N37_23520 [Telmatospirillum sp.]|nr:hypothetical protein [Telmatospirillum sp.]
MSDQKAPDATKILVQDYDIGEPPDKVWRAISNPDLRERWLPANILADPHPASLTPGREIRYRLRDDDPPFLESLVTLRILPHADGGTVLRIIHELTDIRLSRPIPAANMNRPGRMLAA